MEWLVAIALGGAALIGGIFWLGRRDPTTAPFNPGVGRMPGGLTWLRREIAEKEAREKQARERQAEEKQAEEAEAKEAEADRTSNPGWRPQLRALFRRQGSSQIVGTMVCLVYAVVWLVAWFDPPDELTTMFFGDLHHTAGKYIHPAWAALLFAAAPVMRRDTFRSHIVCSVGIVAMMSSALWALVQGRATPEDAVVWLSVPLGIAAWVFFGPATPERAAVPHTPRIERPAGSGLPLLSGIGVVALVIGYLVPAGQLVFDLGFGDIVIPRYAAIGFGFCCFAGGFVVRKLRSDRDGRRRK